MNRNLTVNYAHDVINLEIRTKLTNNFNFFIKLVKLEVKRIK